MTRAQLERMAAEAAASAVEIERMCRFLRSRLTKLEAASAGAREQEARFRAMANSLDTEEALHSGGELSSMDKTKMDISHRLAISRGRKSSNQDAEFKAAYRSKNLTLTSLAAKVDCDAPLLSKYRRKLRRIPQDRAEKIAKLIPWPADAKHWPGGIVPKD